MSRHEGWNACGFCYCDELDEARAESDRLRAAGEDVAACLASSPGVGAYKDKVLSNWRAALREEEPWKTCSSSSFQWCSVLPQPLRLSRSAEPWVSCSMAEPFQYDLFRQDAEITTTVTATLHGLHENVVRTQVYVQRGEAGESKLVDERVHRVPLWRYLNPLDPFS